MGWGEENNKEKKDQTFSSPISSAMNPPRTGERHVSDSALGVFSHQPPLTEPFLRVVVNLFYLISLMSSDTNITWQDYIHHVSITKNWNEKGKRKREETHFILLSSLLRYELDQAEPQAHYADEEIRKEKRVEQAREPYL